MSSENHEQVSIYPFSDEKREELLTKVGECVFNWSTKDGWPVGVIHAFVWRDGRGWITCGVHRHRVSAIRRDPRCSIVVTGTAAPNGPNGSITIKGRAIIHEDEETKNWFYPAHTRPTSPPQVAPRAWPPAECQLETNCTTTQVRQFRVPSALCGSVSMQTIGPAQETGVTKRGAVLLVRIAGHAGRKHYP